VGDKNFHKEFGEGEQPPIPIPPGDQAWSDMRSRLDAGMPENTGTTGAPKNWFGNGMKWFLGSVVVAFISFIVLTQLPAKKQNRVADKTNTIASTSANSTPVSEDAPASGNNAVINSDNKEGTDNKQPGDLDKQTNTAIDSLHSEQGSFSKSGNPKENTRVDDAINKNPEVENAAAVDKTKKQKDYSNKPGKENTAIDKTINKITEQKNNSNKPKNADVVVGNVAKRKTEKQKNSGNRPTSYNRPVVKDKSTGRGIRDKNKALQDKYASGQLTPSAKDKYAGKKPVTVSDKSKTSQDSQESIYDKIHSTTVVADSSEAPLVDRHLPLTLSSEAAKKASSVPVTGLLPLIQVQGGLQWNVQVPAGSSGNYFTGAKGKSEPYRVLLPSAWLSFQKKKSMLSVEVSPFFTASLPKVPYTSFSATSRSRDTIITNTETKTLRKLFGISGSVGYSYNISGNWWAGGSVRGIWWKKGVAISQLEILKRSDSIRFDDIKTTSSRTFSYPDTSWSDFSKTQFILSADILYKRRYWQAGLQIGATLNSLAKGNGPRNPLYAALFFRLAIPGGNRKK
jgi:hypothetical protein